MGRMGRVNITLYADEIERAAGAFWQMVSQEGISEVEEIWYTAHATCLESLMTTLVDGSFEQFVTASVMKLGRADAEQAIDSVKEE